MSRMTATATTGSYKHFLFIVAAMAALDRMPALSLRGFSGDSHPHPGLKKASTTKYYSEPLPPKPFHGTGRNEKCPCGSQIKYKRCCGK